MKRCFIILELSLFSLLLSGCLFHSKFDEGTPKAIMNIPYFFHVAFEYSGEVNGNTDDHSKIEYFETEAPYFRFLNERASTYDEPKFTYFSPNYPRKTNLTYMFYWQLDGPSRNRECPLIRVNLNSIPHIASGVIYEQSDTDPSSQYNCFLELNDESISLYSCKFSFTRVNDDDTIAYTLRLFASDSLSQPQSIQIDFSKKMMALRGVAQNFREYIY